MPKPIMDENHAEYMDRCMADSGMMADHPDDADRKAACEIIWKNESKISQKSRTIGMIERRFCPAMVRLEKREDGKPVIVGHAAVFYEEGNQGTEYLLWKGAIERISPKAFNRAIREKQDVLALFNHDPNNVLGRTSAHTMRLSKDELGLTYQIDPGDTRVAADILEHLRRGDISGSSFSFLATEEKWRKQDEGPDIREILDLDLFDVGPVTFPAYKSTTAGVRTGTGMEDARRSWEAWQAQERALAGRIAERDRRLKILEIST